MRECPRVAGPTVYRQVRCQASSVLREYGCGLDPSPCRNGRDSVRSTPVSLDAANGRPRLPNTCRRAFQGRRTGRSEEHTSELQSLMRNSYAVFCLKKKKKNKRQTKQTKKSKQNITNKY